MPPSRINHGLSVFTHVDAAAAAATTAHRRLRWPLADDRTFPLSNCFNDATSGAFYPGHRSGPRVLILRAPWARPCRPCMAGWWSRSRTATAHPMGSSSPSIPARTRPPIPGSCTPRPIGPRGQVPACNLRLL